MTVLIVAGELDRQANLIVRALVDRDVPCTRIDTAWFPQQLVLDAEFDGHTWSGTLHTPHRSVALDEIRSVFYRSPSAFDLPPGLSTAEREYVRREGKLALGGLFAALPALTVNDPHRAAMAVYKPYQYGMAARHGLHVPPTLLTNSAEPVRRFAQVAPDGVVNKALGTTLVFEEGTYKLGYTRRFVAGELEDLAGVEQTAHQWQRWVPKSFEARVICVGERIFTAGIHARSQSAHIDWRAGIEDLAYEVVEPPGSVIAGVHGMMGELGLQYGAFDFAIDHDNRWWYFEVNPAGVTTWLEAHLGLPITAALADLLAGGRR